MNAADAFDIGSFDEEDTKGIKVQGCPGLSHLSPDPGLQGSCRLLGLRPLPKHALARGGQAYG